METTFKNEALSGEIEVVSNNLKVSSNYFIDKESNKIQKIESGQLIKDRTSTGWFSASKEGDKLTYNFSGITLGEVTEFEPLLEEMELQINNKAKEV